MKAARDEALLGLATTRELLEEVATRMEMRHYEDGALDLSETDGLAKVCRYHLATLTRPILEYRTVDAH